MSGTTRDFRLPDLDALAHGAPYGRPSGPSRIAILATSATVLLAITFIVAFLTGSLVPARVMAIVVLAALAIGAAVDIVGERDGHSVESRIWAFVLGLVFLAMVAFLFFSGRDEISQQHFHTAIWPYVLAFFLAYVAGFWASLAATESGR